MNTTINEIYALISMLLIVIILLFGLGVRLAIKTANATYTNLNNKINTLENITLEKLMLVEEQNKKINDMDETILSLIEQNKLLVKSHYNIVYDINNIQTTISHLTDDTSSQIEELKNIVVSTNEKNENTHATYILEEQTKIDDLKKQLIELSTNISLTNDKITNVSNNNDTEEEEKIQVINFLYDGVNYLKTSDNLLYDLVAKITKNNDVVFCVSDEEALDEEALDEEALNEESHMKVFLYDGVKYLKSAENLLYKDGKHVGKITKYSGWVIFTNEYILSSNRKDDRLA